MSYLRNIIALGGGGFSMEPLNPLLDLYILEQVNKKTPKVCFIGTASGDSKDYINRFYQNFKKHDCVPAHLSLFQGHTAEIEKFILEQDILYVGGGNTRNLMALWREWGLDAIIGKAYQKGILLAGISAGSICWFEQGVTDSTPGKLSPLNCLGLLKGSNCPHYDSEINRRTSYHQLLKEGAIGHGLAADDGVALHFINERLYRAVSSHPEKKAFEVSSSEEKEIPTQYLSSKGPLIRRAAIQDAKGIHHSHMQSIREVCKKDHSPEEINAWGYREYHPDHRQDCIKNHLMWVVEDKGLIEGYAHVMIKDQNASLLGLYFTPAVIGKGLGKAMFKLIIKELKEKKIKKMGLDSTLTAHSFYLSMGAKDTGPMNSIVINSVPIRIYPMEFQIHS